MDILHNEIKGLKVRGIPSIYIYKTTWKEPVFYERYFTKKKLKEFIDYHLAEVITVSQDL